MIDNERYKVDDLMLNGPITKKVRCEFFLNVSDFPGRPKGESADSGR